MDETDKILGENQELREKQKFLTQYIRQKINQLLNVIGTKPLKSEELDDKTLIELDPIGIICDSYAQIHDTKEKLEIAHDEIRAMFDSVEVGIMVVDENMKIKVYNKKIKEQFLKGLTDIDIIGHTCLDVICKGKASCEECCFSEIMATGRGAYRTGIIISDCYFDVTGAPVKNQAGEIYMVVLAYMDITERKKTEAVLVRNEKRLSALLELSQMTNASLQEIASFVLEHGIDLTGSAMGFVGILSDDEKSYTSYAMSKSAMKECMVIDQPLHLVIENAGIWAEAVRQRKVVIINDFSFSHPRKKGLPEGHVPLHRILSVPFFDGNRLVGVAAVANKNEDYTEKDINELTLLMDSMRRHILSRRIEDEMIRTQKLESIGLLAGGIAHDFNNILTAILGNISLTKMHSEPGSKAYERLEEAERASIRARDLTQQLLTFSKGGVPIKKTVLLGELVRESTLFALRGSDMKSEFLIPQDLWPADVDEGQINQVINNIVINAYQAMPGGGTITVTCENIMVPENNNLILNEGRHIRIGIKDQGIGIREEHIKKIFDPYFTTKQKGSGIGLTTAYSIIKRHEGQITVESSLGAGTAFCIYLPASEKKIVDKKPADEKLLLGEGRILIMDDEDIVSEAAGEMLKALGYEVERAREGEEAIEIYKRAFSSQSPFDAVIVDLTISGGMGGKDTIKELLSIDPNIKAIVSSGYSNDPIMADFSEYGFKGVLSKPYKPKELSDTLHKVIFEE